MKTILAAWRALAISASLLTGALAHAADASEVPDRGADLWVTPGILSHHFDRSAGMRDSNPGFGLQWDLARDWSLMAGRYVNSNDASTRYVGAFWWPLHFGESWRAGLAGGLFDGYRSERNGGWFPAAMPVLGWQGRWVGLNLTAIPKVRGPMSSVVSAQVLVRFW